MTAPTASPTKSPKTLFEKVWQQHLVAEPAGEPSILYIDLHLIHEVTSPQAFDGLRMTHRKLRRPERTVATVDHNAPTSASSSTTSSPPIKASFTSSAPNSASPNPA